MAKARDILGTDRDNEFLQSFVRVGLKDEEDNTVKSVYMQSKVPPAAAAGDGQQPVLVKQGSDVRSDGIYSRRSRNSLMPELNNSRKKKRKQREYFDEIYTDKDRAAAVTFGSFDIKQSLSIKRRQDRTEALQLPDDSDPGALYELGLREYKNGNTDTAVLFISKALELNPGDQNALVTRSKCYLLLGEPAKGLADAEEALAADKANIRAIYQKAEALYFLGQFEHSLMFFHRGLRLRPEMNLFRLGVQKSREAIEQTIGGFVPKQTATSVCRSTTTTARRGSAATSTTAAAIKSAELTARTIESLTAGFAAQSPAPLAPPAAAATDAGTVVGPPSQKTTTKIATNRRPRTAATASKLTPEQREAKRLLGELCVDKSYLENLLKHPSIKRADADGEQTITTMARDAVQFLDTRQEFWRQQRPCKSAFPLLKKRLAEGAVLKK